MLLKAERDVRAFLDFTNRYLEMDATKFYHFDKEMLIRDMMKTVEGTKKVAR